MNITPLQKKKRVRILQLFLKSVLEIIVYVYRCKISLTFKDGVKTSPPHPPS
jgi:hypothetical protein